MFDFDALSNAISRQTVLCIGDLMLDEFVYGEVSRISPEAPAPVIAVQRSESNIGGAGNVARNVAALGAERQKAKVEKLEGFVDRAIERGLTMKHVEANIAAGRPPHWIEA